MMKGKRTELIEWLFIAVLFAPVTTLAQLKLHQRNFPLFVVLCMLIVSAVMIGYYCYCRHAGKNSGQPEEPADASDKQG